MREVFLGSRLELTDSVTEIVLLPTLSKKSPLPTSWEPFWAHAVVLQTTLVVAVCRCCTHKLYLDSTMHRLSVFVVYASLLFRVASLISTFFCLAARALTWGVVSRHVKKKGSQFITKANKSLKIARDEFKVVNKILGI